MIYLQIIYFIYKKYKSRIGFRIESESETAELLLKPTQKANYSKSFLKYQFYYQFANRQ